jgi:hypothetical protein
MSVLGNLEAFGTALDERFSDLEKKSGLGAEVGAIWDFVFSLETKIEKELTAKQDETGGKETAALWKRIFALEADLRDMAKDLSAAEGKLVILQDSLEDKINEAIKAAMVEMAEEKVQEAIEDAIEKLPYRLSITLD